MVPSPEYLGRFLRRDIVYRLLVKAGERQHFRDKLLRTFRYVEWRVVLQVGVVIGI